MSDPKNAVKRQRGPGGIFEYQIKPDVLREYSVIPMADEVQPDLDIEAAREAVQTLDDGSASALDFARALDQEFIISIDDLVTAQVSFDMDLDHDPGVKPVLERVMQWFENDAPQGKALVLAGHPGCGKTHICKKVLVACGGLGGRPLYWSEPELVTAIKAVYSGQGDEQAIISQANRAGLLILDDVGVAHVKEMPWMHAIYYQLLDDRFERQLPTLMTTNLMEGPFKERLGSRALDRLLEAMGGPGEGWVDMFGIKSYRLRGFS